MKIKKIDLSPERKFITRLITNDEVINAILPSLDAKLLDTNYSRLIIKWLKEYQEKYERAPRGNIKELYNSNKLTGDDDADEIKTFLISLSKHFETDESYGVEDNQEFAIDECHAYLQKQSENHLAEQIKAAQESGDSIQNILDKYKPYENKSNILPEMNNANDLMKMELPKVKYLVPGLIGWGLVMFAGTHKIGKSFMMLELAIAVSSGGLFLGKHKVKQREVIYLCLEDGALRIQERIKQLNLEDKVTNNLHFIYESRKGDQGLCDLSKRLKQCPKAKLIIIDALATFRGVPKSRQIFQSDYDAMREIKIWADKNHVCVVLVHHTRKPGINYVGPVDIIDSVNGSSGLAAAVDQTLIMTRARKSQDGKIYTTSRDLPEIDLAIHFDMTDGGWTDKGDADKYEITKERLKILNIIEEANAPIKTGEIKELAECSLGRVSQICSKLVLDGFIIKTKYGEYRYVKD